MKTKKGKIVKIKDVKKGVKYLLEKLEKTDAHIPDRDNIEDHVVICKREDHSPNPCPTFKVLNSSSTACCFYCTGKYPVLRELSK